MKSLPGVHELKTNYTGKNMTGVHIDVGNWRLEWQSHRTVWIARINGYRCYSAIIYDDRRIGYDVPEAIPGYVKERVGILARYIALK